MKEIISTFSYVLIGMINGGIFLFADWSDSPAAIRIMAIIMAVIEVIVIRWFLNLIFGKA